MALFKQQGNTIRILKNSGFVGDNVNPCLYVKNSAKGVVYIALFVDNNLMVGDIEAIDDAISALKNIGLVLKVMERWQDYLSCKIKFSKDKKRTWLRQPHLIENVGKKFCNDMQNVWSHNTPGTSKFLIVRPIIDNEKFSVKNQ